jgi:hypothetical protein
MRKGEPAVPLAALRRSSVSRVSTARIVLFAALGLLLLSGTAFAASEALHRDVRTRTVVTEAVHKIVIDGDTGDVDIRAGLTADVVVIHHDAWLVDRPQIKQRYADGVLTITTRCGRLKALLRCRSDLQVEAPPEIDVSVMAQSGDVDLRGLNGRASVQTDSGDIRMHRVDPVTVLAKTGAGDIALDLLGEPARTAAQSSAGDVRVTVPYGAYHVDASTDGGQVKVEGVIRDDLAPQAIDVRSGAGDITIRAR